MFLHLLESVDPDVAQRLHADNRYRPYPLPPTSKRKDAEAPCGLDQRASARFDFETGH